MIPYKAPIIPLEHGFGYPGIVLINDEDKVQCHFCGHWYKAVTGGHVKSHGFSSIADYKAEFGLRQKTALVNEDLRLKLSTYAHNRMLYRLANNEWNLEMNHKPKNGIRKTKYSKEGRRGSEFRNIHGTCNAQLIARLKALSIKFGTEMTCKDIHSIDKSLYSLLKNHFGSFQNALRIADVAPSMYMKTLMSTKDMLVEEINNFVHIYNRIPRSTDFRRELFSCDHRHLKKLFGSVNNAVRAAGFTPIPVDFITSKLPVLEIVQRYNNNESVSSIARYFNCSWKTIADLLKKNGIRIRHMNYASKTVMSHLPTEEIIELYNNGFSMEMLAKRYHCGYNTIRDALKKNAIKIWSITDYKNHSDN
jgi:uncharacterized protein (DUF433 family)